MNILYIVFNTNYGIYFKNYKQWRIMDYYSIIINATKKYRVLGVAIIIALGFVFIIGDQGLKPNVARLRPFVDFPNVTVPLESALPKATSYSFPSVIVLVHLHHL
mgnify:CR=1 FL=1